MLPEFPPIARASASVSSTSSLISQRVHWINSHCPASRNVCRRRGHNLYEHAASSWPATRRLPMSRKCSVESDHHPYVFVGYCCSASSPDKVDTTFGPDRCTWLEPIVRENAEAVGGVSKGSRLQQDAVYYAENGGGDPNAETESQNAGESKLKVFREAAGGIAESMKGRHATNPQRKSEDACGTLCRRPLSVTPFSTSAFQKGLQLGGPSCSEAS